MQTQRNRPSSEDGSFNSEFYDISDDDLDSTSYDSDLEGLDEEEENELYDSMEEHSDESTGLMDYTQSTDPIDITDLDKEESNGAVTDKNTTKATKEIDFSQSMDTISCGDTVSSDMSIDPDWISTDDEEAIEEYLVYREARRQQSNGQCTVQRELEDYEDIDAINIRYWIQGSVATNGKPNTMTSSAGPAALIDMRRVVLPAHEMLRNYFRSTEPSRVVGKSKENVYVGKNMVANRVKGKSNRMALSEKN